MYLKRLQTIGFKSFAERIDLHFNRGLTAIVGPNGSGKSNIIDAIRWVLGEQSARSLRGEKMEDVIFQGSDTRNQMNFAEVTVVLDDVKNSLPLDYEEISVTRRVYRSGESEFFINKQPCRLKDIIDLFMDSGLAREAFSIIGQGKVDEILSSKADERRIIFEEAAGVLKYKQRKHEAQYKLEETEKNLNRVEDIIYEVEQQIAPLEKQAEKAKKYNKITDELKQIELRLLITEINELHEKWQKILKQIETERLDEVEIKTRIQEREAILTKSRQELYDIDERITTLQSDLLQATEQLEKHEGEKNVLDERLKHFVENKEKLSKDKEQIEKRKEDLEKVIKETEIELKQLQLIKNETVQEIDKLNKQLQTASYNVEEKLEDLKAEYIEWLNDEAVNKSEQRAVKQQLETIEQTFSAHQTELNEITKQKTRKREELNILQEEKNWLTDEYEQIKTRDHELKEELTNLLDEKNNLNETYYESSAYLTKLTARKETLKEMKDSYQGYFQGVRSLLHEPEKKDCFKIYGTVFDLLKVPDRYLIAIDTILGAQAQHIVIHSEKHAREAINWLKKENKGRATFLPINAIRDRSLAPHILASIEDEPGFIGVASSLIQFDPKFQIVINHLLGNVIITENLKAANMIAKKTNRSYRIVSIDGDVVYPGGSMTGGARSKNKQSLFMREKELQTLTKKIKDEKQSIQQFVAKMEKITVRTKQITNIRDENKRMIKEYESRLKKLKQSIDDLSFQLQTLENKQSISKQAIEYDKNEMSILKEKEESLKKALKETQTQLQMIQEQIDELTEKEQNLQDEEVKIKEEIHEKEITLAEQDERLKNKKDQLNDLQIELEAVERQYESINEQMIELKQIERFKQEKLKAEQKITEQLSFRDMTQKTLKEENNKRQKLNEWIEDEQRDLQEEHKRHNKVKTDLQAKEVTVNRLDVALDSRLKQLEEKYVITYEKASKQYEKLTDVEEAKEKVVNLKREIDRLGTVNLGAIEEYERILERHIFLTEQQEDLLEAKATLYSVIEEMDEEMINRFKKTFEQVQVAFSDVFKQLFGGGHAKLKLTDETNLLETGIEIIARPPGKKLRTLDLLSGGEKALTAISLLFAILRVRPVPFVILDEVEAALDESNIVRFAKYLKMYSEESQFIVITHRQGTMEEADILYGVTMQESGVSRLVSVKLEDTEDFVKAN